MPIPSLITDLAITAALNSPAGGESVTTADDYLRAQASFIAQLRDSLQAMTTAAGNRSAFSVYQTSVTGIGTSPTLIAFQAKSFDATSAFNTTTGRFTPQVAGYYQANWTVMGDGNTSTLWAYLRKNGVEAGYGSRAAATSFPLSTGNILVYLNGTTDYLEIAAQGSVPSTTHTPIYTTQFSGFLAKSA